MGISLGRIVQVFTMRTFIIACLAVVGAVADSESDAYTIGQVAHGYAPGIVTGVDYGNGLVEGYGAIGNRGYAGYAGHVGYAGHGGYAGHVGYAGYGHGYAGSLGYSGFSGHHLYKRSADSDSYTIGQVAHGLPQANAYATGHPHNPGYVAGISDGNYVGHGVYGGYAGHGVGYAGQGIGYAGHGIGYAGHGYAGHGYAGSLGYGFGK